MCHISWSGQQWKWFYRPHDLLYVCTRKEARYLEGLFLLLSCGFPGVAVVKNLPAVQETLEMRVQSLGQRDPLNWEMATGSSILAWMDRGPRQATGLGVLKDLDRTEHVHTFILGIWLECLSLEFPRKNKSETPEGFLHSWDAI